MFTRLRVACCTFGGGAEVVLEKVRQRKFIVRVDLAVVRAEEVVHAHLRQRSARLPASVETTAQL